jgi:hypothetical protein
MSLVSKPPDHKLLELFFFDSAPLECYQVNFTAEHAPLTCPPRDGAIPEPGRDGAEGKRGTGPAITVRDRQRALRT